MPWSLFPPQMNRMTDTAKALRAGYAPDVPRELAKGVTEPYTVEPGDVLLVQPVDLESPVRLPGDQPVLPDGTIQIGKYGRLAVAGRTVEEIERLVRERISAQEKDAGPITVRVITRASKVFYVLGEVNSPGSFTLTGRETVLDGILTAGGLTPRAAHQRIILVRPTPTGSCRMVLPVCYDDIVQVGDTATNYQLFPGDRIFVPSPGFLEQLCHKKACPPCNPPQTPCPLSPQPTGPGCADGPVKPPYTAPVPALPPVKPAG
jgi:polysaccharide biosynthesis/export protein